MVSSSEVNKIRRKTHVATSDFEEDFFRVANKAASEGRPFYENMTNSSVQGTYRYLCDFVALLAQTNTNKSPRDIKILDWGGGKGMEAYFLTKKGFDVTLFETDDFPHKDFWREYKLKTVTSNSETLPFKNNSFDIIVGFGVLEHVPYDMVALQELCRVLKDSGLLLCFNLPSRTGYLHYIANWRGVKYHDRLYSANEVRWLLKRSGLNIIGRPWHRQIFPKNAVRYKYPKCWEAIDLWLCRYTPLRCIATSLEFVARKQYTHTSVH